MGVETSCVISRKVQTLVGLKYTSLNSDPTEITDSGDGTVPEKSAIWLCEQWREQGQKVQTTILEGINHLKLIKDSRVIEMVGSFSHQK